MDVIKPSQRIGEYIFNYKIGYGSFGDVWAVTSVSNQNEKYAVKITDNKTLFDSLWKEKEILKTLHNPYIIKIFRFHSFENNPGGFIVMELMDFDLGKSMDELIVYEKLKVIEHTLNGLHYLHEEDMIHRDIKPENILLREIPHGLESKISDFGFSKYFPCQAHYEVGSPEYIAPEIKNGGKVDHRCDIFSLAVVMKNLFQKDIEKHGLVMLKEMIETGGAYYPQDRFKDCKEMLNNLEEIYNAPEVRKLIVPRKGTLHPTDEDIRFFLQAKKSPGLIKKLFKPADNIEKLEQLKEEPFFEKSHHVDIELGASYFDRGDFEKAVESFEKAYYNKHIPHPLKTELNQIISHCHFNIEGQEIKAQYFIDKYRWFSGRRVTNDEIEEKISKLLPNISLENERSLK